ncbi:MAG TPA: hypothetical protein VGO58_09665 [Chitinophagaceae bacterium]|jgi:hypothetical protein|nr:hypothetical protein [Chitinophagaceae bacterium]
MAKPYQLLVLFIVSVVMALSCSKDSGGGLDCSTVTNKSFAANIDPIIQSTCNVPSCHAAGSVNGPGPLTNYNQVFSARSQVRAAIASGLMPQGSSLNTAQKNSILCWIDGGAPNN